MRREVAGSVERTAPGSGAAKTGASKRQRRRAAPEGQAFRWRPSANARALLRGLVASGWSSLSRPHVLVSRKTGPQTGPASWPGEDAPPAERRARETKRGGDGARRDAARSGVQPDLADERIVHELRDRMFLGMPGGWD